MNRLLSEVLDEISQDYSISQEKMSPIITQLSTQFYIKLRDFKNLSEQRWSQYKLPDNLYYLIKEKYDLCIKNDVLRISQNNFEIISSNTQSDNYYNDFVDDNYINNDNEDNKNQKENDNKKEDHIHNNKELNNGKENQTKKEIKKETQEDNIEEEIQEEIVEEIQKETTDDKKHDELNNNYIKDNNDKVVSEEQQNKNTSKSELQNEEINKALTKIDNEIENSTTRSEVIGLIEGVLKKIISNPKEDKYKRINIEKIKVKFPYTSINDFFTLCKFTKEDNNSQFLKYSNSIDWLNNILPTIYSHYDIQYDPNKNDQTNFLKSSIRESQFKLYETISTERCLDSSRNINNNNNNNYIKNSEKEKKIPNTEEKQSDKEEDKEKQSDKEKDKGKDSETKLIEAINNEKKRRINIIASSVIIRLPKCYFLTNQSYIKVLQNMKNVHKYIPKQQDKELLKSQQQLIKDNNSTSNNKFCKEFENLLKEPIIVAGDFFFQFPDNYVIKGTFSVNETITDLYNFTRQYIHNPNENFNLLYGEQNYILKESDTQIQNCECGNNYPIILKVFFPVIYCKLKESELNKMKVNLI